MWTDRPLPALRLSRRQLLTRLAGGFGFVGLAGLLGPGAAGAANASRGPQFRPRAKRVIFLFMNGGPSHVDTFDPKPALLKYAGQPLPESYAARLKRKPKGN